jgi:hypothetical protein
MEARGQRITPGIAARSIDAIEKHALRFAAASHRSEPLARLAKIATRTDAARLVSALFLAQSRTATANTDASCPSNTADSGVLRRTAIAEAAWSDADEALGRALQDLDFVDRSFERLESAAVGELADRARRAMGASNLVLQWVRQAARHRSVALLNKVGDRVPFDPAIHELNGEAGSGELVRIVKPTVVRGTEPKQVVLVRGEAELDNAD